MFNKAHNCELTYNDTVSIAYRVSHGKSAASDKQASLVQAVGLNETAPAFWYRSTCTWRESETLSVRTPGSNSLNHQVKVRAGRI